MKLMEQIILDDCDENDFTNIHNHFKSMTSQQLQMVLDLTRTSQNINRKNYEKEYTRTDYT